MTLLSAGFPLSYRPPPSRLFFCPFSLGVLSSLFMLHTFPGVNPSLESAITFVLRAPESCSHLSGFSLVPAVWSAEASLPLGYGSVEGYELYGRWMCVAALSYPIRSPDLTSLYVHRRLGSPH